MASKNLTEVIIDGKIYTLRGYESEEYLQKVASYINNKIAGFKKDDTFRRQSLEVQRTLVDLNIADDYFKTKKQADLLQNELDNKDRQLYDLKHELMALQISLESHDKEIANMQKEIVEYQKEIIRLETELKKGMKKAE